MIKFEAKTQAMGITKLRHKKNQIGVNVYRSRKKSPNTNMNEQIQTVDNSNCWNYRKS